DRIALATLTPLTKEAIEVCASSAPRRPLRRVPGRRLPASARRARRAVLHAGRVEGRSPAALVIPRELQVEALMRHADPMRPIPDQESSKNRSAESERSDDSLGSPA